VLASIDLPAIEKRLETVAKDVVDNDPKRLRARIAELERTGGGSQEDNKRAEEASSDRARLTDTRRASQTSRAFRPV